MDIDHLADEEPLGVGRAHPPAQLDPGRHDFLAEVDLDSRIDVAHHKDAAQLANDLARRR
jgi:hypothetical protein